MWAYYLYCPCVFGGEGRPVLGVGVLYLYETISLIWEKVFLLKKKRKWKYTFTEKYKRKVQIELNFPKQRMASYFLFNIKS